MAYRPGFGISVVRPTAALGTGIHNIFTITGAVVITWLTGRVTKLMDATAATLLLTHTLGPTDIAAVLAAIADDPVGTVYSITGVVANNLFKVEPTGAAGINVGGFMTNGIIAIVGSIYYTTSAAQTGEVEWEICYHPIIPGSTVVAA